MKKNNKKKSKKEGKNPLPLINLHWLEYITLAVGFWFLFYPHPYKLMVTVLLVLPIVGILLNGIGRPSIASLFNSFKGKKNLAIFIHFPAWVLLIRTWLDFNFVSAYNILIPGCLGFVFILGVLFLTHKKVDKSNVNEYWVYTSIAFTMLLYSFSAVSLINCVFDNSTPIEHNVEVINKEANPTNKKLRKRFAITIEPWGERLEKETFYVSKPHFEQITLGNDVNIRDKEGLFGIPWYYLNNSDTPQPGFK